MVIFIFNVIYCQIVSGGICIQRKKESFAIRYHHPLFIFMRQIAYHACHIGNFV